MRANSTRRELNGTEGVHVNTGGCNWASLSICNTTYTAL